MTEKLAYDQKMREQRLSAETTRAKKEMTFYEQKRDLSKKLNKITETRVKNLEKLDQKEQNTENKDDLEVIQKKKQKNLEKMFKYQQRVDARNFKQRTPITNDHI